MDHLCCYRIAIPYHQSSGPSCTKKCRLFWFHLCFKTFLPLEAIQREASRIFTIPRHRNHFRLVRLNFEEYIKYFFRLVNLCVKNIYQLRCSFTLLYHAPRGIKYFEVQTLFQQLHSKKGFVLKVWILVYPYKSIQHYSSDVFLNEHLCLPFCQIIHVTTP